MNIYVQGSMVGPSEVAHPVQYPRYHLIYLA